MRMTIISNLGRPHIQKSFAAGCSWKRSGALGWTRLWANRKHI